jgi:hypothetical protein
MLSVEKNGEIPKEFSMAEIPGPNGFLGNFTNSFGTKLKCHLKKLFDTFTNGNLYIGRLNYGTINDVGIALRVPTD